MKYAKLFSPVKVGACVFPNRIMSTAAVTRLATEDGHITQNIIDRYRRLAAGGRRLDSCGSGGSPPIQKLLQYPHQRRRVH